MLVIILMLLMLKEKSRVNGKNLTSKEQLYMSDNSKMIFRSDYLFISTIKRER